MSEYSAHLPTRGLDALVAGSQLADELTNALYRTNVNLPKDDPLDVSCRDVAHALAPVVARMITDERERIAKAIDAERHGVGDEPPFDWYEGIQHGLSEAARIVRGGAS